MLYLWCTNRYKICEFYIPATISLPTYWLFHNAENIKQVWNMSQLLCYVFLSGPALKRSFDLNLWMFCKANWKVQYDPMQVIYTQGVLHTKQISRISWWSKKLNILIISTCRKSLQEFSKIFNICFCSYCCKNFVTKHYYLAETCPISDSKLLL